MAYIKVATTKNAIAALRYGEHEESVIRSGVDCPADTETACRLFKADRVMWNKDKGVQAHILIQSFKGDECTPQEANEIGQELARRTCPGHRVMVYTHQEAQGGNIHNHIVISAVNHENGRKLDGHGLLFLCRHESDDICKEHGLSVIRERKAKYRYTMAEKALAEKGKISWKDDIRLAVEDGLATCRSLDEFKDYIWNEYGIGIRERGSKQTTSGKQWTYYKSHGGKEVKVRGARLGGDYTADHVLDTLGREPQQRQGRVDYVCASFADAAKVVGGEDVLFKAIVSSEAWKKSIKGRSESEKGKAKKQLRDMIKAGGKAGAKVTVVVSMKGGKVAASVIKASAKLLQHTIGNLPIIGKPVKIAASTVEGASESVKSRLQGIEDGMVNKNAQNERQRTRTQDQQQREEPNEKEEKESGSAGSGSEPQMRDIDALDKLLEYTDYKWLSAMEKDEVRARQVRREI